jgi:hypothetical protein
MFITVLKKLYPLSLPPPKFLLFTTIISSLSFYPYQKDKRAMPGNLLIPLEIKFLSLSPTF